MPIRLERAERAEIPELVAVYFESFSKSPLSLYLKPNLPPVCAWFERNLHSAFDKPEYSHIYKVVDDHADSPGAKAEIIAFANWEGPHEDTAASAGTKSERDWPAEGDPEMFANVVAKAVMMRKEILGDKEHWYLSIMATLPQHQRRGAASLLMTELCGQADAAGQCAYLEASPAGKSTYERFGFETRGSFTTVIKGEGYVDALMVREPRDLA